MAKFYVQSGTLRAVLDSSEIHRAALWVVHQAMAQIAPFDDDIETSPNKKSVQLSKSGLIVLDETITISEIGFDRQDAAKFSTFDVFQEWHRLVQVLDKMDELDG